MTDDQKHTKLLGQYIPNPFFRRFLNLDTWPDTATTILIMLVGYVLVMIFGVIEIQQTDFRFTTYLYISMFGLYMTLGMTPILWFAISLGAFVMVRQLEVGTAAFKSMRRVAIDGPLAVFGVCHRFRTLFAFLTILSASILSIAVFAPIPVASRVAFALILMLFNVAFMQTLLAFVTFGTWAGLRFRSGILGFMVVFVVTIAAYNISLLTLASTAFVNDLSPAVAVALFFVVLLVPQNLVTIGFMLDLKGRVYTAQMKS